MRNPEERLMDTFRLIDSRALVDCAMGRIPADLVIRNGRWVCVQSGEILPGTRYGGQERADRLCGAGRAPVRSARKRASSTPPGATWCRGCWMRTCTSNRAC